MYNVSFRILYNEMEAEDIMQESFIKAFKKLNLFKRKSKYKKDSIPFGSWLKRIVINNSINQLKKNKKMVFTDLMVVKDKIEDSNDEEFSKISVQIVLDEIKKLKPNYRLAITLHLIEGYDYEEVSEIMEVSYQNSRTIISRAKNKLRNSLSKDIASQDLHNKKQ